MSNLIMKECPQGSMVHAPLWHKRSGDKGKRSVYTQDAPSIMPHPTAFALEMVFHSTTLYSVLTVLGAGVIQSISHTLKETVPCKVHRPHHPHPAKQKPLLPIDPDEHKACAPPAKEASVCTSAASRQVLSFLSTGKPLNSTSGLQSHHATADRLPNRPPWLQPLNTQLYCSVSLSAVWQIPPSSTLEKFYLLFDAIPGFLKKVSVLLYVIPLSFMRGNKKSPEGLEPARLLRPWDSPGKNTGVGCHFLLQGIFPAQEWNPGLLHCRQILYHLSHQRSPSSHMWHLCASCIETKSTIQTDDYWKLPAWRFWGAGASLQVVFSMMDMAGLLIPYV